MTTLAPGDPRHGTHNGYVNHNCRCDACRIANTSYNREHKTGGYTRDLCACGRDKVLSADRCRKCVDAEREPEHGTEGRYVNRGCRCDPCRAAANDARRRRRHANIEATRAYDRRRWHAAKEHA